mgnify:FL=1
MFVLAAAIVVLGVLTAVMAKLFYRKDDDGGVVTVGQDCSGCAGGGTKCNMDCMLEAAAKEPEYFDDEELDAYSGRPSDGYTDDEADEFGAVMLSMRPEEVADWCRSLSLRGINVPDQIKDEMMLLIAG